MQENIMISYHIKLTNLRKIELSKLYLIMDLKHME